MSTGRSVPSKYMLNRDVVPFNRNIHKSKLHVDNNFAASGPSVWNNLPEKVRCCDSLYFSSLIEKDNLFSFCFFLHNNPPQLTDLLDIDHIWYPNVIIDVMAP